MKALGYIAFVTLFLIEVTLASLHPDPILALAPWQLALIGWAAFRGGRSISYNGVFAWARAPFTETTPDSSGAGDSVGPRSDLHDFLYAVGDCIACPICTSTHVGSVLLTLIAYFTPFGLILSYALALAGIAETVHWATEKWEWEGRSARELSGSYWLAKNGKKETL